MYYYEEGYSSFHNILTCHIMSVPRFSMYVLLVNSAVGEGVNNQVFFYPDTNAGESLARAMSESLFKQLEDTEGKDRAAWAIVDLWLVDDIRKIFLNTDYRGVLGWTFITMDGYELDMKQVIHRTYEDLDEEDEAAHVVEAVRPTEDGRHFIALNYATLNHRRNEGDVINRFMSGRAYKVLVTPSSAKDQHIIVISHMMHLVDLLDELDPQTIVLDDTLAVEYLNELS